MPVDVCMISKTWSTAQLQNVVAVLHDISKVYPAATAHEIIGMIHEMVGGGEQGVC